MRLLSPFHWLRLGKILWIFLYFGLDRVILDIAPDNRPVAWIRFLGGWRKFNEPRGARIRKALESLGPIFIKFGQMLSTRRDILAPDIADELARLQDKVPPFPGSEARRLVEKSLGPDLKLQDFDDQPIASASVAQVHFARLPDGRKVAAKILRPGIHKIIRHDIALLHVAAELLQRLWSDGRRLHPRAIVGEFEKHIHHELDLLREAANASQLRANFPDSRLLLVPEIYWDYCRSNLMVMQRMQGTPIGNVDELKRRHFDLAALANHGVEIFFTQVFRDGFFHADMHPGNILVAADGRYIALDFGIMGTLSEHDKEFLARNFLAFFHRDYRAVAQYHVDAGWAPPTIRVDEFEAEIRAVCEPIFDKPLQDISFGQLLIRLFNASRRFQIEVQPQLVLLQKTLINIEGLGRQLYPQLDLWATGKPLLERWMREQIGWVGLKRRFLREFPYWSETLPKLPRLLESYLNRPPSPPPAPSPPRWLVLWLLGVTIICVIVTVRQFFN